MKNTYYVEISQHVINEYKVTSDNFLKEGSESLSYQKMVDWMKDNLEKKKPEMVKEDMKIISHKNERSEVYFNVEKERMPKEAFPFQAKGWDLEDNAYIFTSVDSKRLVKTYWAENAGEAAMMARKEFITKDLEEIQSTRKYLHASKFEAITVSPEQTIQIVDEADIHNILKEHFPNGLTVLLPQQSVEELRKMDEAFRQGEGFLMDDWKGIANPEKENLSRIGSELQGVLKLKPKDYNKVFPCGNTYENIGLEQVVTDRGVAAASLMMARHNSLDNFNVEIPQFSDLLDSLYIDGQPFQKVMDKIHERNITNDEDLKQLMQEMYLEQQPDWLKNLAREQTMVERQKTWVNQVGKAIASLNKAKENAIRQVTEKYYIPVSILEGLLNAPMDQYEKIFAETDIIHFEALEIIETVTRPARQEYEMANAQFQKKKTEMENNFVRVFRDFSRKNVNEVTLFPDKMDIWHIRCNINGKKQSSQMVGKTLDERFSPGKSLKEAALEIYKRQIVENMNLTDKLVKGRNR